MKPLPSSRDATSWISTSGTATWQPRVLADIAIVEVALRNALHDALAAAAGAADWYAHDLGFDDRSRRALAEAWNRLKKPQRTPGRVVARLMLGFWVGLLDAGGFYGQEPQAFKADYEQLFRSTLHRAFPGGRFQARSAGAHFTREWVHSTATVVQDLRNRITRAHTGCRHGDHRRVTRPHRERR